MTKVDSSVPIGTKDGAGAPRETLHIRDVLRIAATLIRKNGYHGTSMQDIADALGIRKSSLYHHIKTKQDMLFLILDEAIESVSQGLFEVVELDLSASEKLRLAIRNHIIHLRDHVESIGVLLKERGSLDPEYEKMYLPKRKKYEKAFEKIIEDGVRAGEFREVNPKLTGFAILGMCNWMVQWYSPDGPSSPEEIIEFFTDLAMQMLKK